MTRRPFVSQRSALLAGVALTAALFLGHEVMTRDAFDASLATIGEIVDDSMPSVIDLSELRSVVSEVRFETGQAAHATDPTDRETHRRRAESGFAILEERVRAYEALPSTAEEARVFDELERDVAQLRAAEKRVFESPDPSRAAVEVFAPRATALDRVAMTLVEMNAREAQRAARAIVATHEKAKTHSLEFLVAVMAGVVAIGVVGDRSIARGERATRRVIAELDAFSARVAHDLRGPLSPIALALGMVKSDPALGERLGKTIAIADRSLARATELIDGLLAFARSGARPEPGARCDLELAIGGLVPSLRLLAAEERADLSVSVPPGLQVAASDVAVSSIVSNLARNAFLYLGESERRSVTIRAAARDRSVAIQVEDTGCGIPEAVLPRMFAPFERNSSRPGGHGLGLAIVKRLVEAHGGTVTVKSQVGAGTTFEVSLPVAR